MTSREPNPRLEKIRYELRADGIHPEGVNPLRAGIHTRGYLPHVKREGASYFVTFRLADSLPKEVLTKAMAERAQRLTAFYAQQAHAKAHGTPEPNPSVLEDIEREYFRQVEHYLDKGLGECSLKRPEIAKLVADAMRYFEGKRYLLRGWVVMPNHVHAVLWPMPNHTLSKILQSWKRYTAREANKLLGRAGHEFWQPESYDHWIRNDEERARCCQYVARNPVKAGLCAKPELWPWSSVWQG